MFPCRRDYPKTARRRNIEIALLIDLDAIKAIFTGSPGQYVRLEDTIKGFREIIEGKHDELPEQAFYMVGTIEEAVERAKTMAGEDAPAAAAEEAEEPEASEELEAEPAAV